MHQPPTRTDLHLTETQPLGQQLFSSTTPRELGAAPEDKGHGREAAGGILSSGYREKMVEPEQWTRASQSHLFT